MGKGKRSREELARQDEEDLRRLGYAQKLLREMGGFSNFALSFSIISILTGSVLLYGYGLKLGGPAINTVGWPVVSLFTLAVAASMGELASAYPTAGGLYFWAFRLGGRGWAWVTAWLNMIGQVTVTAGVNVAAAIYGIGAITRILGLPPDAPVPVFGTVTSWSFQLAVMALITLPMVLINVFGIRLIARLNQVSVVWHIGGVVLIAVLLAFFGKYHNDASFLLRAEPAVSPLEASSAQLVPGGPLEPALAVGEARLPSPLFRLVPGLLELYRSGPLWLVFLLGMLQAQWTYTGYDASAHVAEETVMARLNSAWGVFLAVAVSAVAGYVLLLVLTWCIPEGDVARTASDPYPVLFIAYEGLSRFWATVVAVVIGGAMWLCGSASITSMARMWYAFARDEGMPGSGLIKQVSPRWRTPVWSIVITAALSILVCVYAAAFSVVTSISTIALYLAYGIPIFLNLRNRLRGRGEWVTKETAPWNLGRGAAVINGVALGWIALITVVFCLPPNELTLWTMLGVGGMLAVYWAAYARRRFTGPVAADEVALEAMEKEVR